MDSLRSSSVSTQSIKVHFFSNSLNTQHCSGTTTVHISSSKPKVWFGHGDWSVCFCIPWE